MSLIWFLLIGMVGGWLAGQLTRGGGFGLVGNLVIGVIGAFVGGLLMQVAGLSADNTIGELISATVGAIAFLYVLRWLKSSGKI